MLKSKLEELPTLKYKLPNLYKQLELLKPPSLFKQLIKNKSSLLVQAESTLKVVKKELYKVLVKQ